MAAVGLSPLLVFGQTPDLSQLDSDTRLSIEVACAGAKTEGPAPYRACVDGQLASTGLTPEDVASAPPPATTQPRDRISQAPVKAVPKRAAVETPSPARSGDRPARLKSVKAQRETSALQGMYVVLFALMFIYLAPAIWVLLSGRSHGGAKFGWLIVTLCFTWIGLAVFLILTQGSRNRSD